MQHDDRDDRLRPFYNKMERFPWQQSASNIRGDQEGLFKLVTLDRILNRITGVTSGCWWLVIVNNIPISDICQINQ
jgi:hypothetical protein